jgi:hypothetical protein
VLARREYLAFVLLTLGMVASIHSLSQHYYLLLYVVLVIGLARAARRRAPRVGTAGPPATAAVSGEGAAGAVA